MRKRVLFVILVVLAGGGCISIHHSTIDVLSYWSSITSFTAQETIKINNQTFESRVSFTKPDKIIREDYVNGSLAQKIIIENGIQTVITSSGTFTLNATLDDVNALDPFALILNNLNSFNVTKNGNKLLLTPKTPGLPAYTVELNGKLPKRIIIQQEGLRMVIEYRRINVTS
ncbi:MULTISPECIES: hypothetical protein [Pyrococcus]|nr:MULTISPECIES: hypothetical protein [Pyrococcus]MDK2870049.1 hypothetical protein [Pyrococcus sp.]